MCCRSRQEAEKVAEELGVLPFHAGTNTDAIVAFRQGKQQILPVTTALGVGFDYPHIRHVFHFGLAYNVFNFLQEIGRGGRDGEPCIAITITSKPRPQVASDRVYDLGEIALQDWVDRRSAQCLRIIPSRFMDGVPVTCTLL